jgi:hypothetical protein
MTDQELEKKTIDELVRIYNARATVAVQRFRDRKTAEKRVKELYPEGVKSATSLTGPSDTTTDSLTGATEENMAEKATATAPAKKEKKVKSPEELAASKKTREAKVLNCAAGEIKPPKESSKRALLAKFLKSGKKIEDIMATFAGPDGKPWTRSNTMDALRNLHVIHGYGFETNSAGAIKILGA